MKRKWWGVVAVALVVVMALVGCSQSSLPDTAGTPVLDYRRSGGIAGVDDHLVIEADGSATLTRDSEEYEFTLDPERAERLLSRLEAADFADLQEEYLASDEARDIFTYEVSYQGQSVRAQDGAVPPELAPVLDELNEIIEEYGNP